MAKKKTTSIIPTGQKRPVSVRIFAKRWNIETVADQKEMGLCHFSETKITVHPHESMEQERDTVTHEIFHAVSDELGCGLTEKQVEKMAMGFLCVLRDNPGLVRFLTD